MSQGSYRAIFDQNVFVNGSVFNPDALLSNVWVNSPISAILGLPIVPANYFSVIDATTSQCPLWVKMANQVQIKNCVFDGNKGSNYGDYWIGSAITLSRLIGMSSPLIQNCKFQNHIGLWNLSTAALSSLSIGQNVNAAFVDQIIQENSNCFEFFYTQNTAPLITVNFYGGNFEFNYTNNPNSTSTYYEPYLSNASVILDSCSFINNTFNQTSWNYLSSWVNQSLYANHCSIIKGYVINETIEYAVYPAFSSTLSSAFYPNYNPEGFPLQKIFLNVQNSEFINNTVYSPQPLFANTIFDQITITNSTFQGNTITTTDDSSIMSRNTAMFVLSNDNAYRQIKDYQQISITNSQFINNTGPVLFTNYTASKQSEIMNTIILFQNLSFSGQVSRLPIFYIEKLSNVNFSSLYLTNTSIKTSAFLVKNVSAPFQAFQNITIDGINNLQTKMTDSSTIFQALDSLSLCLSMQNSSNCSIASFSCLNTKFQSNTLYSSQIIGACGHFDQVKSLTINNFTCSGASFNSNPSLVAQQTLFLIQDSTQLPYSIIFVNLTVASNNAYQGFVIRNSMVNFASNIKFNSNVFSYIGLSSILSSQINLTDTQVQNNIGPFILAYEGILQLLASTFQNNTASANTILYAYYGTLKIINCNMAQNYATDDGILIQAGQAAFSIENSSFLSNKMSKILIYSVNCELSVINSSFLQNLATTATSNIEVYKGSISLVNVSHEGWSTNSLLTNHVQADFLVALEAQVTLTGLKSSFSQALYGAILLDSGSSGTINNSQFSNGFGTYSWSHSNRCNACVG